MFDDPTFRWVLIAILALVVVVFLWWQDCDGIRSSWEYHSRVRKRERLTGEEFYLRFYAQSGIPAELVIAFRDFHALYWTEEPELLRPEDDLFRINSGEDCAEWAAEVRVMFGVDVPESVTPELCALLPKLEGTFDSVLRCIHTLQTNKPDHR